MGEVRLISEQSIKKETEKSKVQKGNKAQKKEANKTSKGKKEQEKQRGVPEKESETEKSKG